MLFHDNAARYYRLLDVSEPTVSPVRTTHLCLYEIRYQIKFLCLVAPKSFGERQTISQARWN